MEKIIKSILSSAASVAFTLSCLNVPMQSVSASNDNLFTASAGSHEEILRGYDTDTTELLYNYMLTRSGVTPKPDETKNGKAVFYDSGINAGSKFTGNESVVYGFLKQEIQRIAAGDRTSTEIDIPADAFGISEGPWSAADLGVDSIVVNGAISSDAVNALREKINYDYHSVVNALLVDCPYEMYWCDKTSYQTFPGGSISARWENGEYKMYLTSFPKIVFYVSADYAGGVTKTTSFPDGKLSAVNNAISNARNIVNSNSDKRGKELLNAYREVICEAVDYDYNAGNVYGDPWQLINVFDGDDSTKVVCEGYAKAFKFLCDLSADRLPNISCLIASGTSSAPHMWNIVNMEDGRSYHVDVTYCDGIDRPVQEYIDSLFLSIPISGTYDTSYTFEFPGASYTENGYIYTYQSQTFTYTYDNDTKSTYNTKYLTLSSEPYIPIAEPKTPAILEISDFSGTASTVEVDDLAEYALPSVYMDGYDFIGWTVNGTLFTEQESAKDAIAELASNDSAVSVKCTYQQKTAKYSVEVIGGKLINGKTAEDIQVSEIATVKADSANAGKKFSHWLKNGVKVSTDEKYSFRMPSGNVVLSAVFVDSTETVEKAGTAIIESVTANAGTGRVSFVSVLNVPENCTMVKGGLVATNDSSIGRNVTANNAECVKLSAKTTASTNSLKYTWTKSNVTENSTWYVRGYLVYKDANGVQKTVYSDCVAANINGIIS